MTVDLHEVLNECGLSQLSEADKKDLASALLKALEFSVGDSLLPMLSSEQVEAFELRHSASDEEGALAVIREAIPNYEDVVAEHVVLLEAELRARRREILNAVGIYDDDVEPSHVVSSDQVRHDAIHDSEG